MDAILNRASKRKLDNKYKWVPTERNATTQNISSRMKMSDYVLVTDPSGEVVEIPTNPDNTIYMSTLNSMVAGAAGLKFRNPQTGATRAVVVDPAGVKLLPPSDGWDGKVFMAVIPNTPTTPKKVEAKPIDRTSFASPDRQVQGAKIFVGRMTERIEERTLWEYFTRKATSITPNCMVTDVFIPSPFLGFAFVTLSDAEVANRICSHMSYVINGVSVNVSIADGPLNGSQQPEPSPIYKNIDNSRDYGQVLPIQQNSLRQPEPSPGYMDVDNTPDYSEVLPIPPPVQSTVFLEDLYRTGCPPPAAFAVAQAWPTLATPQFVYQQPQTPRQEDIERHQKLKDVNESSSRRRHPESRRRSRTPERDPRPRRRDSPERKREPENLLRGYGYQDDRRSRHGERDRDSNRDRSYNNDRHRTYERSPVRTSKNSYRSRSPQHRTAKGSSAYANSQHAPSKRQERDRMRTEAHIQKMAEQQKPAPPMANRLPLEIISPIVGQIYQPVLPPPNLAEPASIQPNQEGAEVQPLRKSGAARRQRRKQRRLAAEGKIATAEESKDGKSEDVSLTVGQSMKESGLPEKALASDVTPMEIAAPIPVVSKRTIKGRERRQAKKLKRKAAKQQQQQSVTANQNDRIFSCDSPMVVAEATENNQDNGSDLVMVEDTTPLVIVEEEEKSAEARPDDADLELVETCEDETDQCDVESPPLVICDSVEDQHTSLDDDLYLKLGEDSRITGQPNEPRMPESYLADDVGLFELFDNRRKAVAMDDPENQDLIVAAQGYSASGRFIGSEPDPCLKKFVEAVKRQGEDMKHWRSYGGHPKEAVREVAFIQLHKDDRLVNLHTPTMKIVHELGQELEVREELWPTVPSTVTGCPGPFFYRLRFHPREFKMDTFKCHICCMTNHNEENCPLSIYNRRTLLRMLERCFICLQFYGNEVEQTGHHICKNPHVKCCHCDSFGHSAHICENKNHLKRLMRPNIYYNAEQKFEKDSFVVERNGITQEEADEIREAYVVDLEKHSQFIHTVGTFDEDRETCYRTSTAVISEYDILTARSLDKLMEKKAEELYGDRLPYLKQLSKTEVAPWPEKKPKVPLSE